MNKAADLLLTLIVAAAAVAAAALAAGAWPSPGEGRRAEEFHRLVGGPEEVGGRWSLVREEADALSAPPPPEALLLAPDD